MAENEMLDMLYKTPPYAMEAEQAVLGAMLNSKSAVVIATQSLKEDDFFIPGHRTVYALILNMYAASEPIDYVTVTDKLRTSGKLEPIGGSSYLSEIIRSNPENGDISSYIRLIQEKHTLRRLIEASKTILSDSYSGEAGVTRIVDSASQRINELVQQVGTSDYESINEMVIKLIEHLNELMRNKSRVTGIATGFPEFDAMTGGLQNGDLVLVAARPSMGKTSFALNVVQHAAIRENVPTVFFSLEMSKEQIVNRVVASEAFIPLSKLRIGDLSPEEWNVLMHKTNEMKNARLYVDDTGGITPTELLSKARRIKAEHGLGLICVDYLQLMSSGGRVEGRQQEVSAISRSLKAIAKELDVPVVALAQLSRAPELRQSHRPILSDLRESGSIEQDADIVCFLYREGVYNDDPEVKNSAELIIGKQRNGPIGTVNLMWDGDHTSYRPLESSHTEVGK